MSYNRLQDAATQQTAMNTQYSGFISNIQDTNMAQAATQLSLNQTALQAALQVTSSLNQLSLLNYMYVGVQHRGLISFLLRFPGFAPIAPQMSSIRQNTHRGCHGKERLRQQRNGPVDRFGATSAQAWARGRDA